MDTLRAAILCVCTVALGLTLAEGIFPMERFEKPIRLLLSLMLLIGLLQPLTGVDWRTVTERLQATDATETLTDTADAADAVLCQTVSQNLVRSLNIRLSEQQVPCTVRDVIVHIQADRSITISEVIISGNLLTGTVYLKEWLHKDVCVTEQKEER